MKLTGYQRRGMVTDGLVMIFLSFTMWSMNDFFQNLSMFTIFLVVLTIWQKGDLDPEGDK